MRTLPASVLACLVVASLHAQDITGDWQGILHSGSEQTRHILRIAKGTGDEWNAKVFDIDQTHDWGLSVAVRSFRVRASKLKLDIGPMHVTFEGTLSADGNTIAGFWTQGLTLPVAFKRATNGSAWRDPSAHRIEFVNATDGVKLEVLDWGGSGRALVLLAGYGNTAHVFDKFAITLNAGYHVYGITRRGFGASGSSNSGCDTTTPQSTANTDDCLGDDVLTVIEALHLNLPVVAGHSIAGKELTSIGLRHPEKVSGLIYLDAGFNYAMPPSSMIGGELKYAKIQVPILAVFAVPHIAPKSIGNDPAAIAAFEARDEAGSGAQAERFGTALPSARVVRLRHADHYIFISNEADVLHEMNAFLNGLPAAIER
jgi:non-heme chloroperoxidase